MTSRWTELKTCVLFISRNLLNLQITSSFSVTSVFCSQKIIHEQTNLYSRAAFGSSSAMWQSAGCVPDMLLGSHRNVFWRSVKVTHLFLYVSSVFVHWACREAAHSDQHCTGSLPKPKTQRHNKALTFYHTVLGGNSWRTWISVELNLSSYINSRAEVYVVPVQYLCKRLHGQWPFSDQLLPAG